MGRKYKYHKNEILRKDDNNKFLSYAIIFLLVVVIIQLFMLNSKISDLSLKTNVVVDEQNVKTAPSVGDTGSLNKPFADIKPSDLNTLIDDDAFRGSADAPVTMVEFSDFECPFCGRFYRDTLGQIDDKYIKTGKVKLVYRDFPLSFHKNAEKAAEAAECAGEQGKYFEMHDLLFEKGVSGGSTAFKNYASEIGLDRGEFDSCLDSGKMASEVAKDSKDGQSLGVRGTPAFFINGKMITGAQPFAVFDAEIQAALN